MDPNVAAGACVALGFVFVLVEIFLIPGIGFAGVFGAGLICVGGGLVWIEHGIAAGLVTIMGSGMVSLVLVWGFWRSGAAKRFVLQTTLDDDGDGQDRRSELVGRSGVATTSLRPAGQAEIDGERYDVVTDGTFVEGGVAITVASVEGFSLVVEQTQPDPASGPKTEENTA